MKGITPVVAIILLLLITISMVGFAFVWFTRVGELTTQQTQAQLQAELDRQAMKIRIDAVTTTTVTVRNIGSKDILTAQLAAFVDNVAKTCSTTPPAAWPATLTVGTTATCTYTSGTCAAETGTVRVTSPGNSDAVKC